MDFLAEAARFERFADALRKMHTMVIADPYIRSAHATSRIREARIEISRAVEETVCCTRALNNAVDVVNNLNRELRNS